ncbi:MAG: transposase [Bacteroidetes bacterium]|nr:transposase [Bacteroidota bacterium]
MKYLNMSRAYKFPELDLTFATMTVVGWQELFTRRVYQDMLIDSIQHGIDNKGLQIFGYVVMPNHVHLLCNSVKEPLGDIFKSVKSFSAKKLRDAVIEHEGPNRRDRFLNAFRYYKKGNDRDHQIWIHDNQPKHCYTPEMAQQKLEYIEMNPVKAGFVDEPHYWRLSSANEHSPLPVLEL